MPELPEVEITRRALAPQFIGRVIAEVVVGKPSYFFLTAPKLLAQKLPGRQCVRLERLGKYLLARLDDGSTLLFHLGMTGQLFWAHARNPRLGRKDSDSVHRLGQHTHLRLRFVGAGPDVCFRDVRKFGKVKWLPPKAHEKRIEQLGVDALSVIGPELYAATHKRRIPIKSVLLDQSVIAGIGNIYADEALYLAKVRPQRPARRVTERECQQIVASVQKVMQRAIRAGGSSIKDFVSPDGSDGNYQAQRLVYARTGMPCKRCGTAIERRVIATRSSHYCPTCQR